jgi:fatty acid desaturase
MVEVTRERRSDAVSALAISGHIGFVYAGPLVAAAAFEPWLLPLAWLHFGLFGNGLLNLLHECAHGLVFRTKRRSVRLGRYVVGPLIGTDHDSYQNRHWEHHRELGTDRDTKLTYREKIGGRRLAALILRSLTLTEGLRKFRLQTSPHLARPEFRSQGVGWLLRAALAQSVVLALLIAAARIGSPSWSAALAWALVVYGTTILYALVSLTSLMASLRAIAEHQRTPFDDAVEGDAALRNFRCGRLQTLLFGCYGFSEHRTHHEHPAIPYYALRRTTLGLEATGDLPPRSQTYLGLLTSLVRSPVWAKD